MNPNLKARWVMRGVMLFALVAAPFALSTFNVSLLTEILIFGLAAVALNLLVGLAGLASLGHAAFFGLGGYAAGLVSVHLSDSAWLGLLAAVLVGGLFALPAGWLSVRTTGIVFLMLSLAFAQLLYSVSQSWSEVSGGSDGLVGISSPELFPGFTLSSVPTRYYYVVGVFIVVYLLVRRLVDSSFGWAVRGTQSNPVRMEAMGYDVRRTRLIIYMVAGVVGSLAGGLYAQHARYAGPDNFAFLTSAFLLVMVILGGVRYLHGALVGAAILIYLRQELSTRFEGWELGLGVIIVLVMYFLPGGLGSFVDRVRLLASRRKQAASTGPRPNSEVQK